MKKNRLQLLNAHDAADDCFRQKYIKKGDEELVNVMLAMALSGSPEIDDALEPYDRVKLKDAIAKTLSTNPPKLSAQKRASAANDYLDCLESSLLTVDELALQIIGQLVRKIDNTTLIARGHW